MARRRARTLALSALFQIEVGKLEPNATVAHTFAGEKDLEVATYGERLVSGVIEHQKELDARIKAKSRAWSLERMANVDRNLLRIGAYELFYEPEVPTAVVIDEAVAMARIYSTADSPRFVNGILSELAKEARGEEA
jgi:N utilization substance protein B